MTMVYELDGIIPVVHPTAYVHPSAVLIGDVFVGPGCYIGPLAALRGDFGRLLIHEGANIQDTCVLHGFPGGDTVVETDGHIGHGAVLHGCHIGRNALIGMNAVVMDGARIGAESIVGAAALVKAHMDVPPRHLVLGAPARVIRELSQKEIDGKRAGTAQYQQLALRSLQTMRAVTALSEAPAERPRMQW